MEKTPYKITKDLPADYIYVDAYTFPGFKELNPELNLSPYNYNMLVIQIPEYYPYIDIPDTEIGKVSFDTSEDNLVVITRGTVTDPPVGAQIKTYYTITIDGESTTNFFTTETFDLEIIEDYDGATLTAWTTAGDFEGETEETTLVFVKDFSEQYLTFVALEDGTFTFTPQNSNVIYYKKNKGEWSTGNNVEVLTGDKVLWKGEMTPTSGNGIGTFSATGNFDVQGNAMSLLFGDIFKSQTDLTGKSSAFGRLFYNNTKVINANNLSLPATTLASYCYDFMFKDCTSLTTAPELSATTLGDDCYRQMFGGCTSLTTAPELPATTLKTSCYEGMFNGCTSLTTAPELPATTASGSVSKVYKQMFLNCTNLNYIKAMFTFAPNSNWRCDNWVQNVSPTGTFVKNAAATWDVTGESGIPTGWTVETATE